MSVRIFEGFVPETNTHIKIYDTHLAGLQFPICKMRELTQCVPIIGFVT
jgi:hypothetical protein